MMKPLGRNGPSARADCAIFDQRDQHVKPYPLDLKSYPNTRLIQLLHPETTKTTKTLSFLLFSLSLSSPSSLSISFPSS